MKNIFIIFICVLNSSIFSQSYWEKTEMSTMPEPVTNNAVCEGFVNGVVSEIPFVFSFGGIDSTLIFSGIHNRAWRYNINNDIWESIANIPGPEKTIASSASYIDDKIYLIGGYSVASNGSEVSSSKVYIYNVSTDNYSLGTNIPIPIDDHVQCVYNDSLVYIITGWSNSGNVMDVQIYDTYNNSWQTGTSIPNSTNSRVFGSNGIIIGDTLYYYGGANTTTNFPSTNKINKGYINPIDPTDITWQIEDLALPNSYRMSCTSVGDTIFWIGGSETSYNFDAEAYDGSGIVSPSNNILQYYKNNTLLNNVIELPMDLRGIASISNKTKFICGGIEDNGKVSNKLLKLTWTTPIVENIEVLESILYFKNPVLENKIQFSEEVKSVIVYNYNGQLIFENANYNSNLLDVSYLDKGIYFIKLNNSNYKFIKE